MSQQLMWVRGNAEAQQNIRQYDAQRTLSRVTSGLENMSAKCKFCVSFSARVVHSSKSVSALQQQGWR